jgi:hypothetical protein
MAVKDDAEHARFVEEYLRAHLQRHVGRVLDGEKLKTEVADLLAKIAVPGAPWHDNIAQVLAAGWLGMSDDFDARALLRDVPTDALERASGFFDYVAEGPLGWIQMELMVRRGLLEDWSFRRRAADRATVEVKTKKPLDFITVEVEVSPKKP